MYIRLRRSLAPQSPAPLQVARYRTLALDSAGSAQLDGKSTKAYIGCWMFYLPAVEAKIFHASQGMTDCTHSPPEITTIQNINQPVGRYAAGDWFAALETPLAKRLAEIWLVSARLWRAGLGPQPLGICFVDQFSRDGDDLGSSCGLLTQNILKLPRKLDCKLEQIVAAGVIPDQILSCVRQQLRGYVTDLCSVKGCRPTDAEDKVDKLEQLFRPETPDSELIPVLEQSLSW